MKKLKITVLGKTYEVLVEDMGEVNEQMPKNEHPAAAAPPTVPLAPITASQPTEITAPMSGTVIELAVAVGNEIKAGEPLLILEAMKMQNTLPAPVDGVVREIFVRRGDTVTTGTPLLILD